MKNTINTQEQYCTFTVGDLFFGVGVSKVQEVVRFQAMTRVPKAARDVRGLINLRGQIVTAIDLRSRLGMPSCTGERPPMNVLLRTIDGPVSLLVDQIDDVLEVDEYTLEKPPDNLVGATRELIRSASKQKGRILLILDTDKALDLPAARQ